MTPETFIEAFRARHRWKCRPGSQIFDDLANFAAEQAESTHSHDELYVIFCITNGITPKPAVGSEPEGTAPAIGRDDGNG